MSSLLDTDVLSQWIKAKPNPSVIAWLGKVPLEETYLSATSILEVRTGIEMMQTGRKRDALEAWLEDDARKRYAGRILSITAEVADLGGRLIVQRRKSGETPNSNDCLLAAMAIIHGLKLATLNRKHFERLGVELVEF